MIGLATGCQSGHQASNLADSGPLIQRYKYTQLHVGVQVQITLYAENERAAESAAKAAFSELARLEDIFSDYRPHSEVRRLMETAFHQPSTVSKPLFEVLQAAQALAQKTAGAFDVTAGPYTHLWRASRAVNQLPSPDSLIALKDHVGWERMRLDAGAQTVFLTSPGMLVDLGGIAKGYMLDRALLALKDAGIPNAMIEAGGDIVVGAPPPGQAGWRIEVAGATGSFQAAANRLAHAAIASSGAQAQFIEVDGVRYSHVIDPRTGAALTDRWAATVIAPSGLIADSYATTLTVMKEDERGTFLANEVGIQAFVRKID